MAGTTQQFNRNDGVSLKEHLEDKITSIKSEQTVINKMNQVAIDTALNTLNERLAGMNEFRNQMKDQQGTFVTKDLYYSQVESFDKRLKALEITGAKIEGKASQTAFLITMAISIIGIVLSLIKFFM